MKHLTLFSILALTTAACGGSNNNNNNSNTGDNLAFGTEPGYYSPNGAEIPDDDPDRVELEDGTILQITSRDENGEATSFTINGVEPTDQSFASIYIDDGTEDGSDMIAYAFVNGTDGIVAVEHDLELDQAQLESTGFMTLEDAGAYTDIAASGENFSISGIEYIYAWNDNGMDAGAEYGYDGTAEISADGSLGMQLGGVNIDGSINGYNITGDASLNNMDGSAVGIVGVAPDAGTGGTVGTFSGGNSDSGFAGGWLYQY